MFCGGAIVGLISVLLLYLVKERGKTGEWNRLGGIGVEQGDLFGVLVEEDEPPVRGAKAGDAGKYTSPATVSGGVGGEAESDPILEGADDEEDGKLRGEMASRKGKGGAPRSADGTEAKVVGGAP